MTEEQKEILIAKMLDAPSSLSDEELYVVSHDRELRDIYEISSDLSGAYFLQREIDVDAEWKRFRLHRPARKKWYMRIAAIFLGVILLSGVFVKVIDGFLVKEDTASITIANHQHETLPGIQESHVVNANDNDVDPIPNKVEKILFQKSNIVKIQNMELDDILDAEDDIDVENYMRIEQARIDNALAMQVAEIYKEECKEIIPLLESIGMYDADLDKTITSVTIQ